MNVIMKFGGTSVADAEAMGRVLAIVRHKLEMSAPGTPPVVVVSAMSKVTDRLIETARSQLFPVRTENHAVNRVCMALQHH